MGRPRATTQHLQLTGNLSRCSKHYSDRNVEQVDTLTAIPQVPEHYADETKAAWNSIVSGLVQMGVLTSSDLPSLGTMFDAYDEYVQAKNAIRSYDKLHTILEPEYIKNRKMLNTWLTQSQDTFNKLAARFGCMPTERSRLPINQDLVEVEADPLDMLGV